VMKGVLTTHPADNDILAGITREVVLTLAGELGLRVREQPFTKPQLNKAEEVFLTSTTSEILPITRVDGRAIGDSRPGPVTIRLFEAFQREVAR
jgi:D-alanine transaminase